MAAADRSGSFTDRRRRHLALRPGAPDRLEARSSIADLGDPLGMALRAIAGAGLAGLLRPIDVAAGPVAGRGLEEAARPARRRGERAVADASAPRAPGAGARQAMLPVTIGRRGGLAAAAAAGSRVRPAAGWLDLAEARGPSGSSATSARGGAARAGAADPPARGAITPLRVPRAPSAVEAQAPILAAASGGGAVPASGGSEGRDGGAGTTGGGSGSVSAFFDPDGGPAASGGAVAVDGGIFDAVGLDSGAALAQFTNFNLYTLDYNYGVVLFPGAAHAATLGAAVDLRAQVRDDIASAYTFSWDTAGLGSYASSITGTSTYRLRFNWTTSNPTAATASATLTATQSATGTTEVQTYTFRVPSGSTGSGGGSAPTYPEAVGGDLLLPGATAIDAHMGTVDAHSGAFGTTITLPAYSPNFPGLVFAYDTLAADPRPMVLERHTLDDTLAVPTKTSASLTFNGTAGTTYFYDTAKLIAGDIAQFALQADATALSTGRYDYTVTVSDYRTTTTTRTVTGKYNLVSEASSPFGAGWTLAGLARAHELTGGILLSVGAGARALWFASASGGAYTTPAGDFSTVSKSGSVITRTLADGTKQEFRTSDGRQTADVDRNGLRVTYTYDGSGKLTTITDPYSKLTTFAYDGSSKLQTVSDPAGRVATFTVTGGNLASAKLPDNALWSFTYDASKRMTEVQDPRSKRVTVAYDAAGRVGTVTRPDASTQAVTPYQERGYDTSGTSGAPAPATLFAEARTTHTDPNGNATDLRFDWRGLGVANQATDAVGNVANAYVNSSGLATTTIDRLNRIATYAFDSKGNTTQVRHPDGNRATFTYNSSSQVTEAQDENGNRTTYTYDVEGNLTEVRDALSNRTTMTYTANGRVETVKDPLGNVTTLQYDSQDRLTTVTHPAIGGTSSTTLLAYDAKGNVATVTDERGNSTTYAFDALNRVTGVKDALGNLATVTYDSGGNLTVRQLPTPAGQTARTTTVTYDDMNRPVTVTAPLSRTTGYSYDPGGRLLTETDALSRVVTYAYDALDRMTVVTSPQEGATVRRVTTTYDAEGQVLTRTDPLGRVATYQYDSRGRVGTMVNSVPATFTYSYTPTGKPSAQTDPVSGGSSLVQYNYDAADRLVSTQDALGNRTTTVYDSGGNVQATVDPNGNRVTYTYDARNRPVEARDPLGNRTTFVLDGAGNRTTVVDPLGKRTTTTFDALDRAVQVQDARGGLTTLVFDEAGRNTVVVDPASNRTTFAYDAADRVTTRTDALGTVTFGYDAADQLTGRTDRLARQVTFGYDSGGRRTGETWLTSGGAVDRRITYTFDAADQLLAVRDPDATLTFTYDSGGRLATARTSGGGTGQPDLTLTYGYDALGKRTSMTDNLASVGRTTYAYDAAQRLTTQTRSTGGTERAWVVTAYDSGGRRTTIRRTTNGAGTSVATTFSYDAADRVTTITHRVEGGSVLATFAYGYDSGGRLTTETNAEGLATYTYDDTHQLTGVDRPVGQTDESYGYDLAGNRNTSGYTTTTGNRMTAAPGYTYAYDAEGNLVTRVQLNGAGTADDITTTFVYDHRNRMTGARTTTNAGVETARVTYAYDALGHRIRTQVDADGAGAGAAATTWTAFDGDNPYADFDGSGTLATRYLYGPAVDELLARTDSGGTTAWYLPDRLGSVRDIASTAGAVLWHGAYDGFGGLVTQTGAGGDRFRFTAREFEVSTGLQYNRARFYDAAAGKWMSVDPIGFEGGDANLYRYVFNQSTTFIDPTGLTYIPIVLISTGAFGPPSLPRPIRQQIYEAQRIELDEAMKEQMAKVRARFDGHMQRLRVAKEELNSLARAGYEAMSDEQRRKYERLLKEVAIYENNVEDAHAEMRAIQADFQSRYAALINQFNYNNSGLTHPVP
jgi:RHS repeat-associated protein